MDSGGLGAGCSFWLKRQRRQMSIKCHDQMLQINRSIDRSFVGNTVNTVNVAYGQIYRSSDRAGNYMKHATLDENGIG